MSRQKRNDTDNPYVVDSCLKTIQQVMDRTKGQDMDKVRREMKQSYPFGERKGQRYKIWNKLSNQALYIRERVG